MSKESKRNHNILDPSKIRGIPRKSSESNEREFEPLTKIKEKQVRVIIGNLPDEMNSLFIYIIKKVVAQKYDLDFFISYYAEDIVEFADKENIDIFVIVLNNIRFIPVLEPVDRLYTALKFIGYLKERYKKPLIVLTGLGEEFSSLISRAKEIADFFYYLPVTSSNFWEAIEKCFDMLPGFYDLPSKSYKKKGC